MYKATNRLTSALCQPSGVREWRYGVVVVRRARVVEEPISANNAPPLVGVDVHWGSGMWVYGALVRSPNEFRVQDSRMRACLATEGVVGCSLARVDPQVMFFSRGQC